MVHQQDSPMLVCGDLASRALTTHRQHQPNHRSTDSASVAVEVGRSDCFFVPCITLLLPRDVEVSHNGQHHWHLFLSWYRMQYPMSVDYNGNILSFFSLKWNGFVFLTSCTNIPLAFCCSCLLTLKLVLKIRSWWFAWTACVVPTRKTRVKHFVIWASAAFLHLAWWRTWAA